MRYDKFADVLNKNEERCHFRPLSLLFEQLLIG